jgi:hypothetical protein
MYIPWTKTVPADRSFSFAGHTSWNDLLKLTFSNEIESTNLDKFKLELKLILLANVNHIDTYFAL